MSDTQNKDSNSGRYGGLRPWKPGQSGNPGGRPKLNIALRQKCRDLDEESLAALRAALAVPGERVAAAKVLLAYGHGAPESKPLLDEDEAGPTVADEVRKLSRDELRKLADADLSKH